jgi:hypothetical protein
MLCAATRSAAREGLSDAIVAAKAGKASGSYFDSTHKMKKLLFNKNKKNDGIGWVGLQY